MRGLRRRSEFLAANSGRRAPMPAFVLLVRPRDDDDAAMGVGFTVTKKIGNAVVRNRVKRRFRALARELLPEGGLAGADHVLIGRSAALERDYATLGEDLRKALAKCALPSTSNRHPGPGPASTGRRKTRRMAKSDGGSRTRSGVTDESAP